MDISWLLKAGREEGRSIFFYFNKSLIQRWSIKQENWYKNCIFLLLSSRGRARQSQGYKKLSLSCSSASIYCFLSADNEEKSQEKWDSESGVERARARCWLSHIAWSTFTFSRALESFVWVRKIKAIVMGSKERECCHVANQSLHNNNCLFSCNEGLYLSNVELRVVRLAQSSELCLLR